MNNKWHSCFRTTRLRWICHISVDFVIYLFYIFDMFMISFCSFCVIFQVAGLIAQLWKKGASSARFTQTVPPVPSLPECPVKLRKSEVLVFSLTPFPGLASVREPQRFRAPDSYSTQTDKYLSRFASTRWCLQRTSSSAQTAISSALNAGKIMWQQWRPGRGCGCIWKCPKIRSLSLLSGFLWMKTRIRTRKGTMTRI